MPGKRIAREKLTIKKMIALYESQCPQASAVQGHYDALFAYAQKRLDKCVFGEEKPACKQCPVHCYQPAKREGDEADYALDRSANALATPCPDRAAPYRR
ncbi:Nitrous oxide-stimulated promoter [Salmonella enterica subsp. enterica serovar Daytona]|uniref:Nitrous oxide-stimulated promoter n=1 Tax=Salmonella enterica subsp. enterica serovar Daytona TaxID=1962639 RepID=A0A447JDE9_SALET|nr:Nitrous oxide-stimulated promoter [Salmonella enterica subsp. enterica serovar Daytona]